MPVSRRNIFLAGIWVMILFGCSSPSLEKTQPRTGVTLTGKFLTTNPDVINFPIRIVFAIDCSGSMMGSDPGRRRMTAVQKFIERYHPFESVEFGVILWNNSVVRSTGGFTRDLTLLNDVLSYDGNNSTTSYSSAISETRQYFLSEINNMYSDNAQQANISRMKCIVLFFSDGLPNPIDGSTNSAHAKIAASVAELRNELIDVRKVAKFNFHCFFLSELLANPDPPNTLEGYYHAVNLMQNMANEGRGEYVEFMTANAIDFINIVDMRLTVEYVVKYIIAFNTNVRPGTELVYVDSDGDGLPDFEEDINLDGIIDNTQGETDPTLRDTDGDGLSDYFEVRLSEIDNYLDPNNPSDSGCPIGAEGFDRDRDGMSDCEEDIKGTFYNSPDTDRDGIPDGIEFYMRTNPLEAQYIADSDWDGVSDWLEVQRHSNPKSNDPKIRERYSYHYDLVDEGVITLNPNTEHESRRRIISYNISNIDIMNTLPSDGRPAGENLIRLFIAEVPEDMPESNPIYRVADIRVNYVEGAQEIYVDNFEDL